MKASEQKLLIQIYYQKKPAFKIPIENTIHFKGLVERSILEDKILHYRWGEKIRTEYISGTETSLRIGNGPNNQALSIFLMIERREKEQRKRRKRCEELSKLKGAKYWIKNSQFITEATKETKKSNQIEEKRKQRLESLKKIDKQKKYLLRKEKKRQEDEEHKRKRAKEASLLQERKLRLEREKWIKEALPLLEIQIILKKTIFQKRFLEIPFKRESPYRKKIDERVKRHFKNLKLIAKATNKEILFHSENLDQYNDASEAKKEKWDIKTIARLSEEYIPTIPLEPESLDSIENKHLTKQEAKR